MAFKVICVLVVIAMVTARPRTSNSVEGSDEDSYEFQYQVQEASDLLDFGHKEIKKGKRVEGYYYVLLPDSRTQKVRYYVDEDSGYVAEVSYSGEAQYDDSTNQIRRFG